MSGNRNGGIWFGLLLCGLVDSQCTVKMARVLLGFPNGYSERLMKVALEARFSPAIRLADGQPIEAWIPVVLYAQSLRRFP